MKKNISLLTNLGTTMCIAVAVAACVTEKPEPQSAANLAKTSTVETAEIIKNCAVCHGNNGISENTDWPNLAGQNTKYLVLQLTNFRNNKRNSPLMNGVLSDLSDEQLRNIANYYSGLPQAVGEDFEVLKTLPGVHVRAQCVSCHGMNGQSVTSLWPNINSQQKGYIAQQLRDYKSGKRRHPIMKVIAKELNDQQIDDVAEFYSRQ